MIEYGADTQYFRKVFVVEPSHSVKALKQYADEIKFITAGVESIGEMQPIIEQVLKDFDPRQDAIVALGRLNANLLTGLILSKMHPKEGIVLGVYEDKDYTFIKVGADNGTSKAISFIYGDMEEM